MNSQTVTALLTNSQAAAPSVLEAAIAAYKQEKRKLWKARKAGAQAGWGFAKTHSSWPKPDMKASSTLGPLRMSSKNSSPAQPRISSASLEGAAAQPALHQQQGKQQADALQQPWPQADTPHAAPSIRHDQATAKLQRMHPIAASQRDTDPAQACAATAADLFSIAEVANAQTVENRECLITNNSRIDTVQSSNQAGAQYDAADSLLPPLARHSLNPVNSLPAAAALSACPAAPLVAQLDQLADLQSHFTDGSQDADEDWDQPQCQCDSELQADEAVQLCVAAHNDADIQSTSSSHEQLTPQAALSGSGSAADSHTNPGSCSESDSEGESQASAGASVEQNDWLPPQVLRWQDPTGRHDDLGLSFDYPSQQDSEGGPESSSHAIEQQATTGPDQKGTAAAAASFDQQVMPDRLSDWSMHSEDGFCSWPSTPLHDPLSRESSTRRVPMMNSKQASKGASKVQRVRKSWGSDDAIIRDRFTSTPQGERLMLA
ncbi:MAG: hypothetical protein FRX49_12185 [Trebouxia sp. A1-2]|nr:MAG: hypothetical protein FRX49_12185 [Trebouxia sp. A1-2]